MKKIILMMFTVLILMSCERNLSPYVETGILVQNTGSELVIWRKHGVDYSYDFNEKTLNQANKIPVGSQVILTIQPSIRWYRSHKCLDVKMIK